MRVLGVGDSCDLGSMYVSLLRDGHDVRVHVADPDAHDTCAGLVPRVEDWRAELAWLGDGVVVFETAHHGEVQDELRRQGFRVVGGSAEGDRLESDRAHGQGVLRELGLQVAATWSFRRYDEAAAHVRSRPGRYVLKFHGSGLSSARTYVGQRDDGADLLGLLAWHDGRTSTPDAGFVLMEHRAGVEVGVGAFFDGRRFLGPACLDWEHKRLFPSDLGEMTGEMGTLVTWRGAERLFDATLARLAPRLAEAGHHGWVNLNTIVDADGVWPLELTCRFGYPGFAILQPLQRVPWAELLARVADGSGPATFPTADGWSIGVVLTVPPFPRPDRYGELAKGLPITVLAPRSDDEHHLHWNEVARADGRLVTSGQVGYLGVATGTGATPDAAVTAAYERAGRVVVPFLRYRDDIGRRFVQTDRRRLEALGWL